MIAGLDLSRLTWQHVAILAILAVLTAYGISLDHSVVGVVVRGAMALLGGAGTIAVRSMRAPADPPPPEP